MTGPRVRTREKIAAPSGTYLGNDRLWRVENGVRKSIIWSANITTGQAILDRREKCIDETHVPLTAPDHLRKGGPLDLVRVEVKRPFTQRSYDCSSQNLVYQYVGRFHCGRIPSLAFLPLPGSNRDEVASYSAQAWNRFRPGRPSVNLGVFLGELRELPQMLKETCSRLRDLYRGFSSLIKKGGKPLDYQGVIRRAGPQAGRDYLSYQFGWAPFVGDLMRAYELSKQIDRRLSDIIRNNGKLRRRGGVLVDESDTVVTYDGTDEGCLTPTLSSPIYKTRPYRQSTTHTAKHYWFEGAFHYYIPDIGSLQWKNRTIRKLYGLQLNAETAWNLLPWTWMIDWFGNIGDVIASMDSGWADNLTAKYAFMMGTDVRIVTHNCSASFWLGGSASLSTEIQYWQKQRIGASPFGFSVSYDSLSPRRLAILAALGMSRLRGRGFFK